MVGRYTSTIGYQPSGAVGLANSRYQQAMAQLNTLGGQQKADLEKRYKALEGRGVQDLTSRGLMATTILPSMRMGVQRQHQEELRRLNDQLTREKLAAQQGYTQMEQSAMLSDAAQQWRQQLAAMQMAQQGGRRVSTRYNSRSAPAPTYASSYSQPATSSLSFGNTLANNRAYTRLRG